MSNVIEQAAREYADVAKSYLLGEEMELVRNAFEAGAEWALANQWHEISRGKIPNDVDILIRFEDGSIKRYDEELPELLVTHWCEISPFENKQPKK